MCATLSRDRSRGRCPETVTSLSITGVESLGNADTGAEPPGNADTGIEALGNADTGIEAPGNAD